MNKRIAKLENAICDLRNRIYLYQKFYGDEPNGQVWIPCREYGLLRAYEFRLDVLRCIAEL